MVIGVLAKIPEVGLAEVPSAPVPSPLRTYTAKKQPVPLIHGVQSNANVQLELTCEYPVTVQLNTVVPGVQYGLEVPDATRCTLKSLSVFAEVPPVMTIVHEVDVPTTSPLAVKVPSVGHVYG